MFGVGPRPLLIVLFLYSCDLFASARDVHHAAPLSTSSSGLPSRQSPGPSKLNSYISPAQTSDWMVIFDNDGEDRGIWQGFGVSLAWWANLFGTDERIADMVFTLHESVDVVGDDATNVDGILRQLPGLGLNVVRYNAGGSCGQARDDRGPRPRVAAHGPPSTNEYRGIPAEPCSYDGATAIQTNIQDYKRIQTFWRNGRSRDVEDENSWLWEVVVDQTDEKILVDGAQRTMLQMAVEKIQQQPDFFRNTGYGRNTSLKVELFSNSPPWWMLKSHNPSGATAGSWFSAGATMEQTNNNLLEENEEKFAYYLAQIAKRFRERHNIDFTSIEPFNEPRGAGLGPFHHQWWFSPSSTQEGCNVSADQQQRVLKHLRAALEQDLATSSPRGRTTSGTRVQPDLSASDENTMERAANSWGTFDTATRSSIGKINVHGYEGLMADRVSVARLAVAKPLWMSEYIEGRVVGERSMGIMHRYSDADYWDGEWPSHGMLMVKNIMYDFLWLLPESWSYWQVFDETDGWGLLKFGNNADEGWWGENKARWKVNTKYFLLAQFSRHIRPGMTVKKAWALDGDNIHVVSAWDKVSAKLTFVIAVYNSGVQVSFQLGGAYEVQGGQDDFGASLLGGQEYQTQRGGGPISGNNVKRGAGRASTGVRVRAFQTISNDPSVRYREQVDAAKVSVGGNSVLLSIKLKPWSVVSVDVHGLIAKDI